MTATALCPAPCRVTHAGSFTPSLSARIPAGRQLADACEQLAFERPQCGGIDGIRALEVARIDAARVRIAETFVDLRRVAERHAFAFRGCDHDAGEVGDDGAFAGLLRAAAALALRRRWRDGDDFLHEAARRFLGEFTPGFLHLRREGSDAALNRPQVKSHSGIHGASIR